MEPERFAGFFEHFRERASVRTDVSTEPAPAQERDLPGFQAIPHATASMPSAA
jgi:hypothetical protein